MIRALGMLAVAIGLALGISHSYADSEIVVAIRYLQAQGESHAHLFLYREDGTLLRQLTKEDSGQDLDPMFAPDGETIVFTREVGEKKFEFWSVEPKGGGLKRLESEPEWYATTKTPGEPAFLAMSYQRYVPIPGTKKTANCSYLERWDASLKKVRYAREGTAAICYGASIYRPGKTPATINMRKSGD